MMSILDSRTDTLLLLEDDSRIRAALEEIYSPHCRLIVRSDIKGGLAVLLSRPERLSAVVVGVGIPKEDKRRLFLRMRKEGLMSKLPVFLISDGLDDQTLEEAYHLGVMDILRTPLVPCVALRRVQSAVELFQSRRQLTRVVESQKADLIAQNQKVRRFSQGMIEALATAIEFRSDESGGHVRRIYSITKFLLTNTAFGDGLSPEAIENIAIASILHDVGKISVPDVILNKPGKLTPEEFEVMKAHTVQGADLLQRIPQFRDHGAYIYACDIARHHHERWDGGGYPDGLKGEEISVWAQVVSLADVYDALSTKRVYKDAYPRRQVVQMIREGQCGIFNPQLLSCFFEVEEACSRLYLPGRVGGPAAC